MRARWLWPLLSLSESSNYRYTVVLRPETGEWPYPDLYPVPSKDKDVQRERRHKAVKERRLRLKNQGLCTYCCNPTDDTTRCRDCLSKFNEYESGRGANKTREQKNRINANDKKRRQSRREAGLCTYCKKPVSGTQARCQECDEKFAEYSRTRRARRSAEQKEKENSANRERTKRLKEQGLCVNCGEPAVKGIGSCQKHREDNQKRDAARRGKPNRSLTNERHCGS